MEGTQLAFDQSRVDENLDVVSFHPLPPEYLADDQLLVAQSLIEWA